MALPRAASRQLHNSYALGTQPPASRHSRGQLLFFAVRCGATLRTSLSESSTLPTATLPRDEIERWAAAPLPELMAEAARLRDLGHGNIVSYSRKVFIPLTRLCRDTCRYCTFVRGPRGVASAYLSPDEVLAIARAGADAGCQEALFTLGDKPELKYEAARRALDRLGYKTTIDYLAAMCALVLRETGLLPHVNPGVMSEADIAALRRVSVSQGMMLENVSPRLGERGGPHHGSPDKAPAARLATHRGGGQAQGAVHHRHPDRHRRDARRAHRLAAGDRRDCIAATAISRKSSSRISAPRTTPAWRARRSRTRTTCCGPSRWRGSCSGRRMNIQAPPNLSPGLIARSDRRRHQRLGRRLAGDARPRQSRSAVARDRTAARRHRGGGQVPDRAAGDLSRIMCASRRAGSIRHCTPPCCAPRMRTAMRAARTGRRDCATQAIGRFSAAAPAIASSTIDRIIGRASAGQRLGEGDIVTLFAARGGEFDAVCAAADALRKSVSGDTVGYVVNRNINYTNICNYGCRFCAFSKGKLGDTLRGPAYDLDRDEIERRVREAWDRGATEVCMQGGIHPRYTGETYLDILDAAKRAVQRHPRPCVLAAGGASRRDEPRHDASAIISTGCATPGSAACRAPRPKSSTTTCARCSARTSCRRTQWLAIVEAAHRRGLAHHRDHHVRPCRPAGALGAAPAAHPRSAGAHRRLHRVRAAAVRAHGSAALSEGPRAQGPDLPRDGADARGVAAGAASADSEHPGVVGEARRGGRRRLPQRRRQRSRRHA